MTKPSKKSVAIFIGVSDVLSHAIAATVDVTVTASPSPQFPRKHGTPDEWRAIVDNIRNESDESETAIVAEAFKMVSTTPETVTIYCASLSLGVRAAAGTGKTFEQYPTIAAAEAWTQFGFLARTMGAKIVFV